jgi:beta-lactamase superfamily II metal-dependent hydrolase
MFSLTIFDVGHGFCAYAVTPKGAKILFDCGYDKDLEFYPSRYFSDRNITYIDQLILSHFDQDHVCDLPDLRKSVTFGAIRRNTSVPVAFLESEKREVGAISTAMASAIQMHRDWTLPVSEPDWGGAKITTFNNDYPGFTDTNNLSLVTFLEFDGFGIVIPGDLERAGWKKLLERQSFRECLLRTNIFIASHHGRNAGYCEEVFEYCSPDLVVLSDKNIVHASQEHDYTGHSKGITWNTDEVRRVLTTRSDGHIHITKESGKGAFITVGFTL